MYLVAWLTLLHYSAADTRRRTAAYSLPAAYASEIKTQKRLISGICYHSKLIIYSLAADVSLCKKATIHQVTTMLAITKNALSIGHNNLLTTGTDDPRLIIARVPATVMTWK